jgi:ribonuclease E
MAARMLIDASHPEETRVVVLKGNKIDEFDFETSIKQTLKGNIYLAKVTRVEPSLQAAFVEYGGNRHGFLAFSEIHPDYYQIPVADRQALLDAQAAEDAAAAAEEEAEDDEAAASSAGEAAAALDGAGESDGAADESDSLRESDFDHQEAAPDSGDDASDASHQSMADRTGLEPEVMASPPVQAGDGPDQADTVGSDEAIDGREAGEIETDKADDGEAGEDHGNHGHIEEAPAQPVDVATVGGDVLDEVRQPRRRFPVRQYKIQEVIKRRQILLVQVVKEERGNKGAALTTYLSLAGRYCVLMPNTARGGGISRKIVSSADRKRLKTIAQDLDPPDGMGVIVRTAGMERSKAEIKRDFDFLLRSWDQIRELTLRSTAPALVYEEGSLIKRAIRDIYHKDVEEVWVEGEDGYRQAKDLMRVLMPSHARRVQPYRDRIPLFHRFQVEPQLDAMYIPTVQLKSGGYIVINTTEALVAIDVNSGRSTREHNIEETAYRTNLEAAEEVARQLRLRDLAGLIVIDFIDMENSRNGRNVERRLKDCLKGDRARIQVGRISPFGLLEMSRQRLRPSLIEASTQICPHCNGLGHVRSVESSALHVLRAIEEEGTRDRTDEMTVYLNGAAAIYLLNHKRAQLGEIEQRYATQVIVAVDDSLVPPANRIERTRTRTPDPSRIEALKEWRVAPVVDEDDPPSEEIEEEDVPLSAAADDVQYELEPAAEADGEESPEARTESRADATDEDGRRRRRRRRRRRGDRDGDDQPGERRSSEAVIPAPRPPIQTPANALDLYADIDTDRPDLPSGGDDSQGGDVPENSDRAADGSDVAGGEGDPRRRRRGRRGGRRRREFGDRDRPVSDAEGAAPADPAEAEQPAVEEWPAIAASTAAEPLGLEPMTAPPAHEPVPVPFIEAEPLPAAVAAPATDAVVATESPRLLPGQTEPVVAEIKVVSAEQPAEEKKTRFGWWRRKG